MNVFLLVMTVASFIVIAIIFSVARVSRHFEHRRRRQLEEALRALDHENTQTIVE
jgi:hypothetical protein